MFLILFILSIISLFVVLFYNKTKIKNIINNFSKMDELDRKNNNGTDINNKINIENERGKNKMTISKRKKYVEKNKIYEKESQVISLNLSPINNTNKNLNINNDENKKDIKKILEPKT